MPRIVVDNSTLTEQPAARTWGDLLQRLDLDLGLKGRVVVAVRLDGIEEVTFRDPEVLVRPLADLAAIEVESDRPGELLRASVQEASRALEAFRAATRSAGTAFRRGETVAALRDVAQLAEGLGTLLAIVRAASLAFGVNEAFGTSGASDLADLAKESDDSVAALVEAHRASDWVTAADVLEYDLEPLLTKWQSVLATLQLLAVEDIRIAV